MLRKYLVVLLNLLLLPLASPRFAQERSSKSVRIRQQAPSAVKEKVRLVTLDPGHFHAALVQKTEYPGVSPVVHVYAPPGTDLDEHLKLIENYNTRRESPTRWDEKLYTGPDFLEKMLAEKPGNLVVIAGNNRKKLGRFSRAINRPQRH